MFFADGDPIREFILTATPDGNGIWRASLSWGGAPSTGTSGAFCLLVEHALGTKPDPLDLAGIMYTLARLFAEWYTHEGGETECRYRRIAGALTDPPDRIELSVTDERESTELLALRFGNAEPFEWEFGNRAAAMAAALLASDALDRFAAGYARADRSLPPGTLMRVDYTRETAARDAAAQSA